MKRKFAVLAAVLTATALLGGCKQKAQETETQTQVIETETQTETETAETGTFDQGEVLPEGKVRRIFTVPFHRPALNVLMLSMRHR